jgi:hypothetical protein
MRIAILLAAVLILLPAAAQQYEEEQTREYEEQDSRYYERYAEKSTEETTEDLLSRADEMIRDRNYRSAECEHYRVQSDDPRLDAEAALELLEAFRDHFESFWSGRITLANYNDRSRVFLFYSFKKFNDLLAGDYRFNDSRPWGHYGSRSDVIIMHSDATSPQALANGLVHEAAHQLGEQRLFASEGLHSIPWLSEGLASYFGYTFQDSSGAFIAGVAGDKASHLMDERRGRSRSEVKQALKTARQLLKRAERDGIPAVRRLLSIENASEFLGDRAYENYALSWAVVHYLLHGEEGARAEAFVRYIELERQGRRRPEALLQELSMSFEELQAAVALHLETIKVRSRSGSSQPPVIPRSHRCPRS